MNDYLRVSSNAFSYRLVKGVIKALLISFVALSSVGLIIASITNNNFMIAYVLIISLFLQIAWLSITVFLESKNLGYKIEKNSLLYREGIFSIKNLTVPFIKITNATFTQSLFQRLFSVGNIEIDQEDSVEELKGIDKDSATSILKEISSKSNIQPISRQ